MTELNKKFDDRLIKLLEKEVIKEQWKKKAKLTGAVIKKGMTKKGSFMFTVKTRKSEYKLVVPQHRKEEFEIAGGINEGDTIKAIGDRQISGLIFCDRIRKLSKGSFDEKQVKLLN